MLPLGRLLILGVIGWAVVAGSVGCGDDAGTSGPDERASAEAARSAQNGPGAPVDDASPADGEAAAPAEIAFAGTARCASCHPAEAAAWRGSHHDRAMEPASPETVEGRFDGRTLTHFLQTWRFLRDGDAYVIESITEDPAGASDPSVERLVVEYTFGVAPLQQYLVSRGDGRRQALPAAWDARAAEEGGQRWFSLWPNEPVPVADPLHWDQLAYNWNSQCASCHSTALDKGFDLETGRFETTAAEDDVACEACHGPGQAHATAYGEGGSVGSDGSEPSATALPVRFEPWSDGDWQRTEPARIASRVVPRQHDAQLDVCAPCHARRSERVARPEIGAAFLDGYRPAFLEPDLYYDDGQIRDEVYVWGSFSQSRMAMAGVRCADCHEPHSLALRRDGNALCTGCHAPSAYDVPTHRGHASAPVDCVDCHMPSRVYMGVDARRDHAFGLPRPRRSAALGSPDACATCHPDQDADASARAIEQWRGARPMRPHWADVLVRDGVARTDSERWLEIAQDETHAPIVRGTAWARYASEAQAAPARAILEERLSNGTALERLGLIEVARRLPPAIRLSLLDPLLDDERRVVRLAATNALADVPARFWRPARRAALARGLREYRAGERARAERPEALVNLGTLAMRQDDRAGARGMYTRALERADYYVPAYVNLADLERAEGDDAAAIDLLRRALEFAPEEAAVRYSLGLALHRAGDAEGALAELESAAKSAPESPRLTLGWALSLDGAGRRSEAIAVLEAAVDRGEANGDVFQALVTFLRDSGDPRRALEFTDRWLEIEPGAPNARGLREQLAPLVEPSAAVPQVDGGLPEFRRDPTG